MLSVEPRLVVFNTANLNDSPPSVLSKCMVAVAFKKHRSIRSWLLVSKVMLVSDQDLSPRVPALVVQDGKYDRLLRLLYDDIQKYETEVSLVYSSKLSQEIDLRMISIAFLTQGSCSATNLCS